MSEHKMLPYITPENSYIHKKEPDKEADLSKHIIFTHKPQTCSCSMVTEYLRTFAPKWVGSAVHFANS